MRLKRTGRFAALALLLTGAACDEGLTDINQNPNNPEEVPVTAVLGSGIWDLVSNSAGRGVLGEWTTLFHLNLWAQHIAQATYNEEDLYAPREGINELIWAEMFAGGLQDIRRAQDIAVDTGDENLEAVTDILLVYGFLFLTDTFGDIPYTEALNVEASAAPAFTPQSEIYPDLLARLEAAAAQITPGRTVTWAQGDLVYGGDLERWIEFANSLRLRVAMRTSKTSFAGTAATEFQEAWSGNRFDGNDDNADLDWTGTLPSQNPVYEHIVLGGRTADFRVSKTLVDLMADDPRLAIYADPAVSDGVIRGLPNGWLPAEIGSGTTVNDYSTIGSAFVAADAPSVLLSYAEVLFLGAEAAARGWILADPGTLYRQAIEASMAQYGVSAAATAAFVAAHPYTGLNDILEQKWVALYLLGPESFADVRRTGIPNLPLPGPPGSAVINSLPTRMPYPADEGLYNPNFEPYLNVDFTQPLWWM